MCFTIYHPTHKIKIRDVTECNRLKISDYLLISAIDLVIGLFITGTLSIMRLCKCMKQALHNNIQVGYTSKKLIQ